MSRVAALRDYLENYYAQHGGDLPFHGWHHIVFVTDKATALAQEIGYPDVDLITAAALTHDLNYLVDSYSRASEGKSLREKILIENGYTIDEIVHIEMIIVQGDLRNRDDDICIEAQILSDADTLFKSLPIMLPLFTPRYFVQTGIGIERLSNSIVEQQVPLLEKDIYFYTKPYCERYSEWARRNVELWVSIKDAIQDKDVQNLLENAGIKK